MGERKGEMAKKVALVILSLAVLLELKRCRGHSPMENVEEQMDWVTENAKGKAENIKQITEEALHNGQEKSESWTGWAKEKGSEASGDTNYASEKTEEAKNLASHYFDDAANVASEKA